MSIAPQALERSVLERKERDELAAIAEAMGVKPSSRASKATLIVATTSGPGNSAAKPTPNRSAMPSDSPSSVPVNVSSATKWSSPGSVDWSVEVSGRWVSGPIRRL